MSTHEKTYELVCQHTRETAMLQSVAAVLEWDERCYLPADGAAYRAEQLTYLAAQAHRRRTDSRLGLWLDDLATSPLAADRHSVAGATIRQLRREYERQSRLPEKLVEELARTTSLAQASWVEARKNNDFASFRPWLEKTFELKRQQAACYGYSASAYDALLDDYEPGATSAEILPVLEGLREALAPLVAAIGGAKRRAPLQVVNRLFPIDAQRRFGKEVASKIGFEFQRGRLDVTHHPFCTNLGPSDTRLTTRYNEKFFPSAFFGILHEAGHGIYDQGLPSEHYGLPPGSAVSLGIHESQSRLWENLVGRGRAFWTHFFPAAREAFPASLADVSLDDFHFAVNHVQPSLIRVEADEVTYNLHIVVRFELEHALLEGHLSVADLPGAWKEKYEKYLGITPTSDAEGVMQDVHWSAGLVGYFPTYALGNLYAAQFLEQAEAEVGPLEPQFARGDFAPLLHWLRAKIHVHGQCYSSSELVRRITGRPLEHASLVRMMGNKFGPLYGITL